MYGDALFWYACVTGLGEYSVYVLFIYHNDDADYGNNDKYIISYYIISTTNIVSVIQLQL